MKKVIAIIVTTSMVFVLLTATSCKNGQPDTELAPTVAPSATPTSSPTLITEPIYSFTEYKALADYFKLLSPELYGTNEVRIPYINSEALALREREGYSKITLYTEGELARPWIWYHCSFNDANVRIKTMYLSADEAAYAEGKTCSELIKHIDPTAVNVDNAAEHTNYASVTQQELRLSDRTVSAMVCVGAISETSYYFVYDNVLTAVSANHSFFTDNADFFEGFSLDKVGEQ